MTDNGEDRVEKNRRDMKGVVAVWAAVLTAGLGLLALSYARDGQALMPGPLSPAHRSASDCSTCHSNVGKGAFGWVHAILAKADSRADNTRCLACHSLGEKPHMPHGLASAQLERITKENKSQAAKAGFFERVSRSGFLSASLADNGRGQSEISCAICHAEHRGPNSATKADSGAACNACHQSRFSSFQDGHPDFGNYPFHRRSSIKFDHQKHFAKNFDEARSKRPDLKSPPAACSDCHVVGSGGRKMGNKPFAETCSACHLPQIIGSDRATGPKGVALITLPGIDLETLAERKAPIGDWPEDSEAELTPLMRVLLARDEERRTLLEALDKLDLQDLTAASNAQVSKVTALVWEIKELVHELMTSNATSLLRRIRASTGGRVSREEITSLLGTLPRDVLVAAQKDWLPTLDAEMARRRTPGWEKDFRAKANAARKATRKTDLEEQAESSAQTELVNNPKGGRWYVSVLGEIVQEGLEPRETLNAARGEVEVAKSKKRVEDRRRGEPATGEAVNGPRKSRIVDDETWSEFGGWYRKDHAILYRPTGHADRVLHTWLNVSAKRAGEDGTNRLADIFELLSQKESTGRCTKCHSVEEASDGAVVVNWKPDRHRQSEDGFTTFAHMPHFSLLDEKGCLTCHKLDGPKDFEAAYKSLKPQPLASSFKPVAKATCAECHGDGGAPQECGHCHNYHVEKATTPLAETRLPLKPPKAK